MKRIICLLLTYVMLVTLIPIPAFAETAEIASGTCGDDLIWALTEDGTLTISGTGDMTDYSVYVGGNAPWYDYSFRTIITKVVIEDGVTSIGDYAFYNCSNMTCVTIPDSVTSIGKSTFFKCSSLTNITMPNSITRVGTYAFSSCSNLISVSISDSITELGDSVFSYCTSLPSITIPASVTLIQEFAFDECTNLSEIIFLGDAPHRYSNGGTQYAVFEADNAIAYYPAGNSTWTESVMRSYGEHITWLPYDAHDDALVYLETLEISTSDRYTGNQGDSFINVLGTRNGTVDIHGNQMEHGLEAWIARWNYKNEISWAWVEYELDAQYTNLSGKLTIISDCYNSTNFDSTIEILGDGILLYSAALKPGMEVAQVDVDISGVNTLRIHVYDNVAVKGGTSFGLWDFSVSVGDGSVEECDHRWDSGVETKAPTCTECGGITYTCELCGETKIEDTLPLGHDYVDRTCSRCGKRDFILAYDVWSFDNSYASYGAASEGYYISNSDYQRLISNLTETERYALLIEETKKEIGDKGAISVIKQKLSNYNIDNAFTDEQCVDWGGSCYGMSTWVCLNSYGIRKASDIDGSTSVLNLYNNRPEVESAINYYHFQQQLDQVMSVKKEYMSLSQPEQIEILQELGQQANETGKTFLICYSYYSGFNPDGSCDTTTGGGHAVVGYGWEEIEPREISVLDTKYIYNYRILIYDCADPEHALGDRNIYFNDDGVWCIPGYKMVSDDSKAADDRSDNANLEIVTSNVSALNSIDYISGECAPLVAITTLKTAANIPYTIECNGCVANISGFTVTSETDEHGILATIDYNITADGTTQPSVSTVVLPDSDNYIIRTEDHSMAFSFRNEDYLTTCEIGTPGSMTFTNEGTVSLLADGSTPYYLNLIANDGCRNLPWYQIEIAGESASSVLVEKTDTGIVVRSDNLNTIVVAVTDDNGTTEVIGNSDNDAILISQNNGVPIICEDSDGDGTFENDVTHIHYYGNPHFVWSDGNTCEATFTCIDGDDTQTVICTVTNETIPATESEAGATVYTATAEFNGQPYTDTKTVEIPATGHVTHVTTLVSAVDATCEHTGNFAYYTCSGCDLWFEDAEATKVIDDHDSVIIPLADHSYKSVVTDPTCTEQGYTTNTCSVCGDSYVDTYIKATGHSFGEWTETKAATCTGQGEESRSCTCGDTETRKINALGHSWIDSSAVIKECGRCGHTEGGYRIPLDSEEFSAMGSVWIDGVEYAVTCTDGNYYVDLEHTNATNLVVYTYNDPDAEDIHTQYPTGMKVWILKYQDGAYNAKYVKELDNLLQYSGSSIRITGKKGIRMITSITKNNKQALTGKGLAGYTLVEYGTALAWASELEGDNPLILGQSYTKSNYAYKKGVADPIFKDTGKLVQYTNVLVGFNDDQCIPDIAMRPYIIIQDSEGRQITIYGGIVYRSIGYIAYQNRNAFKAGSSSYEYVWSIIHHVYGKKYDAEYKG